MWAAFSWSAVLEPEQGPATCQSIPNFINNWKSDASVNTSLFSKNKIRSRTDPEKIRFCIISITPLLIFMLFNLRVDMLMRTHIFFVMLTNNLEFKVQHINSTHFINGNFFLLSSLFSTSILFSVR
jgi:hypothetical protein